MQSNEHDRFRTDCDVRAVVEFGHRQVRQIETSAGEAYVILANVEVGDGVHPL